MIVEVMLVLSGSLSYNSFESMVTVQYPCLMQREDMRIFLRSPKKLRKERLHRLYWNGETDFKILDSIRNTAKQTGWM